MVTKTTNIQVAKKVVMLSFFGWIGLCESICHRKGRRLLFNRPVGRLSGVTQPGPQKMMPERASQLRLCSPAISWPDAPPGASRGNNDAARFEEDRARHEIECHHGAYIGAVMHRH